jgi:hypothetical protein
VSSSAALRLILAMRWSELGYLEFAVVLCCGDQCLNAQRHLFDRSLWFWKQRTAWLSNSVLESAIDCSCSPVEGRDEWVAHGSYPPLLSGSCGCAPTPFPRMA